MRKYLPSIGLMTMAILASILFSDCSGEKMKPNDIAIHHVIERTMLDLNSLNIGFRLTLVGIGGSIDHNTGKEKTITISIDLKHPMSKEACRWLIVEIAKRFLVNINDDQNLREYLPAGGFGYNNLDVSVFFSNPDHSRLYYPDIAWVDIVKGRISYVKNDPEDKDGGYRPYKEVISESLDEAFKIVESQGRPVELNGNNS